MVFQHDHFQTEAGAFSRARQFIPTSHSGEAIARITAVDRDQYIVRSAEREVPARLTGRAVHSADSPVALPCVGDWVSVTFHDAGAHASILDIQPRTSFLRRRRPVATLSSR
jgi:ribosome biogenesis GTPase